MMIRRMGESEWDREAWLIDMIATGLCDEDRAVLVSMKDTAPGTGFLDWQNKIPTRTSCLFAALGLKSGASGGGFYDGESWISERGKRVVARIEAMKADG